MSGRPEDFNKFVLLAVEKLARERAGGGYDLHRAFTQDLTYGHDCCVRASRPLCEHPPCPTMCVAAVSEVIIEALNLYANQAGDYAPFAKLPMRSWNNGSPKDIRAYIFQYDDVDCHGTADALSKFGIGRELPFYTLLPGDFITMNRTTGSGHTAVFLGYIDKAYGEEPTYSNKVAGFRYFSAQGKGKPDAGFAFRWAFFSPNCPDVVAGKPRDCNIILSDDQKILNTGCMLHPDAWNVDRALDALQSNYLARKLTDKDLQTELRFSVPSRYDGITDD